MKRYDKLWVPNDLDQLATEYMLIGPKTPYPICGLDLKENIIVITEEQLLDLMQESIEHSYPTLLRGKAADLLKAKLANS